MQIESLSLEELAQQLLELTGSMEAIGVELSEVAMQLQTQDQAVVSIEELHQQILTEGASYTTALALEQHYPEALPERFPVASFTKIPSKTNLRVALEAAASSKLGMIAAGFAVIFAMLYRLVKWIIGILNQTKGSNQVAAAEAAKAATANTTVQEVETAARSGKLSVEGFDPNEVDRIRQEVFLTPATEQIHKLTYQLLFEHSPTLRGLYMSAVQWLHGKNNLIAQTESAIARTSDKFQQYYGSLSMDKDELDLSLVEQYEQPLRPLVYNLAKGQVVELKQVFAGVSKHSGIKDYLIPVDPDLYRESVEIATNMFVESNNVLAIEDPEVKANLESNRYFNVASYRTPMILTDIEGSAAWLLANVSLSPTLEKDISRLERSLRNLEAVCDAVRGFSSRNSSVSILYPKMRAHIEAFQRDIQFLTRLTAGVRFMLRDGTMFFKLLTAGESVVLNYINSLNKPETDAALKEIVNKNRKKHEEILRRFKGYINE